MDELAAILRHAREIGAQIEQHLNGGNHGDAGKTKVARRTHAENRAEIEQGKERLNEQIAAEFRLMAHEIESGNLPRARRKR